MAKSNVIYLYNDKGDFNYSFPMEHTVLFVVKNNVERYDFWWYYHGNKLFFL